MVNRSKRIRCACPHLKVYIRGIGPPGLQMFFPAVLKILLKLSITYADTISLSLEVISKTFFEMGSMNP
jgi:hypothetical protein